MTDILPTPKKALIVLGCPEAPSQQALAFHVVHNLRKRGSDVLIAGNPSVLNLLEKCIAEVVEKKRDGDLCVVFAHNDAAIAYAATMRHLLPERRLVVIVFGKDPGPLAEEINFPCEKIVDKAVHNPLQLRAKINEVFGWAVSRT
jgi:threonyl-tRNA synthetase